MKKVGLIALGCAKNRVDAEVLLGILQQHGYQICNDLSVCDAAIVHTCTFIDDANTESIEAILEAAEYKAHGHLKKLIVTGCMAQRYQKQIIESMPEVDAVLGSKSFDRICEAIEATDGYEHYAPLSVPTQEGMRILTEKPYSVYVKVADGCSNHCSYCVIPLVRGEFDARKYENVMAEIKDLVGRGAKEINLIAQDTTRYADLCRVIRETCRIDSVKWVRVLYCYPTTIRDEMLHLMAEEPKFVPYIDLPLQHASGRILKLMNRRGDDVYLRDLIAHIRSIVPDVSLRTTFITGFPKESEEDFEILKKFIKDIQFNNLGVFPYSRQEGTAAGKMRGQVPQAVRQTRADLLMQQQQRLLRTINKQYVGNVYDVLCEGKQSHTGKYVGRAYFQAPDVDGRILFTSDTPVEEGTFVRVRIERFRQYDLYGKRVD